LGLGFRRCLDLSIGALHDHVDNVLLLLIILLTCCFHSLTFLFHGCIRMRGYYSTKHKLEGYEDGIIKSYYFTPTEKKDQMLKYRAVKLPIYMREFPVSWRDIDKGVSNIMN